MPDTTLAKTINADVLLPCPNPWCDSHDIKEGGPRAPEDVWTIEDTIIERFRVQCPYCYMKGPGANSEAEAIAAWNRRATLSTPHAGTEPVAWMYERNDGQHRFVEKNRWGVLSTEGPLGYVETPLYSHPPKPAEPMPDTTLAQTIADAPKANDNPAFMDAWRQMEADGYQYSEYNIEKVHLGWLMAIHSLTKPAT